MNDNVKQNKASGAVPAFLVVIGFIALTASVSADTRFFDGEKKILISVHNTTITWNKLEKEYLQRYGNNDIVLVHEYTSGSGIDTVDGEFIVDPDGWAARADDIIQNAREAEHCPDCPVIFAAQAGTGNNWVSDPDDAADVALSLGELEFLTDHLMASGADKVLITSYSYEHFHSRFVQNTPAVYDAFNSNRSDGAYAIDFVTPTQEDEYLAMCADLMHVNSYGSALLSSVWFKAMLHLDGLDVPEWVSTYLESERAVEQETRNAMGSLSVRKGRYKIGDTIRIEWPDFDCTEIDGDPVDVVKVWMYWRGQDTLLKGSSTSWLTIQEGYGSRGTKIDCSEKTVEVHITENSFPKNYLKQSYGHLPSPFVFSIGYNSVNSAHWISTNMDYENPTEMILLYPDTVIDESLPIYPQTTGSTGVSQRLRKDGGPSLFRAAHTPVRAEKVYNLRGRLLEHGLRGQRNSDHGSGIVILKSDHAVRLYHGSIERKAER